MIKNTLPPETSALDVSALDRLKRAAVAGAPNSPEKTKAAAQQFEAMFIGMVMKSMREATPTEGLLGSEQGKMMTGMLDQQLSQTLAARGVGLAEILARQMTPGGGAPSAPAPGSARHSGATLFTSPVSAPTSSSSSSSPPTASVSPFAPALSSPLAPALSSPLSTPFAVPFVSSLAHPPSAAPAAASAPAVRHIGKHSKFTEFTARLGEHAQAASAATGIPARFMLAQAALESGWGRREIRQADGSSSHNVFGIKAGSQWKGKTVEVTTTEYVNGVPEKKLQRFRAYDSYAEAFRDYASLLTGSPRYAPVVASAANANDFARGLQKAGYATDPHYADKLIGVIRRV